MHAFSYICVWVSYNSYTVYPKKCAHGFVVLCFVVVMQSFIMNSHEVFIHIHQGCFAGTGAIVRLPQCQWSKPDGYGKISQCITTTKHSKAKTVCIFLGVYCIYSSCYYHHLIGSTHLSHCCYIFSVVVCLWCLLHHTLLLNAYTYRKGREFFFSLLLCSLWWMQIIGYILSWRSYSFVCSFHHLIIIIVQTCLKTLNLSSVWVR